MYILLIICLFKISSAYAVVHTNSGPIQGVSSLAEDVEAYLGIPYAEPPVGELRFSKPVPKGKWSEIYNASSLPPPCPQISLEPHYYFMPDISNMSEDCLYLNIWAPKSKSADILKPVIIFIHPGIFITGSSNIETFDGSHLASRGDLVVATINYRLGAFGYFLAYIEQADGNMGMYDQVMAMKWIKSNAKFFGGDPENIVLMGSSAGAYSVSAHMVSPLSKFLFNKAIIQSGSFLNPFLTDGNSKLFKHSEMLASLVGCTNRTVTLKSDPKSVVKCLKSKPKEDFIEAEKILVNTNFFLFYPRMNDPFLPKNTVSEFYRKGHFRKDIDILMGIAKEEGTLLLMLGLPEYFGNYGRNYENNMNRIRALSLSKAILSAFNQNKASEITSFYLSRMKNATGIDYTKMLANILGDFSISCSTVFLADFISSKSNPVYFYKFEFQSPSTPAEDWVGTTHLDELQYVFGNPFHSNFTDEEMELSNRLINRWSTFARTGDPNIPAHMPWYRYSYHKPVYMSFGQKEESLHFKPNSLCEIWRRRFDAHFDSQSN